MSATLTLIDLAGAIALLLWGVHMVQSGIQRAFGPNLRRFLGRALGSRCRAFLAGLGVTATQPVVDVILAAAVTWAAHSSVATVLLIMSFAANGVIPPHAGFALVLGANLGAALIPLLEGAPGGDPIAKRLPVGNLLNRLIGCALGLLLLDWIGPAIVRFE